MNHSITLAQAVESRKIEKQLAQKTENFIDNFMTEENFNDNKNENQELYELWVKDETGEEIQLANFKPKIIEQIEKVYLDRTEFLIKLGVFQDGDLNGEVECSVSDLGQKDFYYNKFGLSRGIWVKAHSEEKIKQYLLETRGDIPVRQEFCFKGRSEEGQIFVSEALGVICQKETIAMERTELKYILESLFKILPDERMKILFSIGLLSPMMTSFAKWKFNRPAFATLIQAESGSRKTTIASLVFCFDPVGQAPFSFEATPAYISEKLKEMRDHALLADDIHPKVDGLLDKIETMVRAVGDVGSTRQNLKKRSTATVTSAVIPVMTGEFIPKLSASSAVRVLLLTFEKEEVDLDCLTAAQVGIECYKTFFRKWIAYTMTEENLVQEMHCRYDRYNKASQRRFPKLHARICANYGWVRAVFELFVEYCKKYLPESEELLEEESRALSEYIDASLEQEEQRIIQENGPKKYLDILMTMKELSKVKFSRIYEKETATVAEDAKNTVLWYDRDYVYFQADKVVRYLDMALEDGDSITARRFREMLYEEGCLKKRRNLLTEDKSINRQRKRISRVERNILKEKYEFEVEW